MARRSAANTSPEALANTNGQPKIQPPAGGFTPAPLTLQ
jgi:hypothetical protein